MPANDMQVNTRNCQEAACMARSYELSFMTVIFLYRNDKTLKSP